MDEQVMVSVICSTYNHEKFIRDALDGFVMQKTNFVYEILVHDDASTDGTADIIREYEAEYPDLIKPIYQTENQYSKKAGLVGKIQRDRAKGKYVAICEGDDYWTDPLKLQKQYDAMESNPEIDICAHRADCVTEFDKRYISTIAPANCDTILTPEQVIMGGGNYVATDSLFFRVSLYSNMPEFRKKYSFDYTLQIHGSLRGGMLYLNDAMSCYRIRRSGSWTSGTMKDKQKRIDSWNGTIKLRNILNQETGYIYDEAIKKADMQAEFMIMKISGKRRALRNHPYYATFSAKQKISLFIELYCPIIFKLRNRVKGKL